MNRKVIALIIALVIVPFMIFSQPKNDGSDSDQGDETVSLPEKVTPRHSPSIEENANINSDFNLYFRAYRAVREDNLALCTTEICKSTVSLMLDMRYIAQGKCSSVRTPMCKELCDKLTSKTCETFTVGWKKDYCLGMQRGDANLLDKSIQEGDVDMAKGIGYPIAKVDAVTGLAVYSGYAKSSMSACETVMHSERVPLTRSLACKVIFASDVNKATNGLLADVAAFLTSRTNNNLGACDSIDNSEIKKACKDPNVNNLEDAGQ